MKFIIVALLFALAHADKRIIGGSQLNQNDVPYLVNIRTRYSASYLCGGSLLSENWVLSAARCNAPADNLIVTAGDHSLSYTEETEQASYVYRTIPHQFYDSKTLENDIMLVLLVSPISENGFIKFASLPEEFSKPTGSTCNLYGWGNTATNNENYSDTPHGATMKVISNSDCTKYHGLGVTPNMMCLQGFKIGSCTGDLGGPVICNGELHGIVSWGMGCDGTEVTDVFTRVSEYIEWIDHIMNL